MEQEIWKPVVGYEGYYEVSNIGNVRSVDRYVESTTTRPRFRKSQPTKKHLDKYGYFVVYLQKHSTCKTIKVHRLVAEAFIPNPNNYPCVNHKNEVKTDNFVQNLEWCTVKYNNGYGTRGQKISDALIDKPKDLNSILQCDTNGKILKEYRCIFDVGKYGFCVNDVRDCCHYKHNSRSHKGYIWLYKKNISDLDNLVKQYKQSHFIIDINMYNENDELIKTYHTIKEASNDTSISTCTIKRSLSGLHIRSKFYFKYAE